jgi:hypothetical protein
MRISLILGDKYRGVSYTYTQMCIVTHEKKTKKKKKIHLAMAERHLHSSWTSSLTPFSIDL